MSLKVPVAFLFPALLFGQAGRPTPDTPIPEEILFQIFFRHYSSGESTAASRGKVESPMKRALKHQVGLADSEFSLLKEVAAGCNDAYDAKSRSGNAEVRQLASQNAQRSPAPPAVADRINTLERERRKILSDCLDSLKRGMPAVRYEKLRAYVWQTEGATVRYIDPAKPEMKGAKAPPPGAFPSGGDPRQGGLK